MRFLSNSPSRPRVPRVSATLAAAAWLALAIPVRAAEPVVTIANFTFEPASLTVHAGSRVVFRNADDIPHSVVMADGGFHSAPLDTDEQTVVTFPKTGHFAYFCGLHPHMQGEVVVIP